MPTQAGSRPSAPSSARAGAWNRFAFSLLRLAVVALLKVARLRGIYLGARAFGTLEWCINYKRRRRFYKALERIRGGKQTIREKLRHSRTFFMNARCDKVLYLIFDAIPRDQAAGLLTIDPQETLDDALTHGRGAYMALSHQGPHHVVGMLLALKGYKAVGVRDPKEGGIRKYVQDRLDRRYPEFARLRWLFAGTFPREIYRRFEEGYVLGSAMDALRVRSANQRTIEAPMFGESRAILTGPLRIAIRCGTPVLQAFFMPEPGFRYRLKIVETLVEAGQQKDQTEIHETVQRYAANVESFLRQYPALTSRI